MDIRQNDELRIRGFAREFTNKIQKLKKKAHLNAEDSVIIYYKFGQNAKNLQLAIVNEFKNISNTVKKPLYSYDQYFGLVEIANDQGLIDEE